MTREQLDRLVDERFGHVSAAAQAARAAGEAGDPVPSEGWFNARVVFRGSETIATFVQRTSGKYVAIEWWQPYPDMSVGPAAAIYYADRPGGHITAETLS